MLRKNIQKNAKIEDFGLPKPSQNRPKMPPKTRFEKTCYFYRIRGRFFIVFRLADIEILCAQPVFCKDFLFFAFSDLASFLVPKNLPKSLPKRGPNPSKIDAENVLFFNIDFWRCWPPFWSLLGLQNGAKLAPNALQT